MFNIERVVNISLYIFTFKSLPSNNDTIQDALEHGYFSDIELVLDGPDDKCRYAIKQLATIYNFIAKMLTNDYYDKCIIGYEQILPFDTAKECKYWVNPRYDVSFPTDLFGFRKIDQNDDIIKAFITNRITMVTDDDPQEIVSNIPNADTTYSRVCCTNDPSYKSFNIRFKTENFNFNEYYNVIKTNINDLKEYIETYRNNNKTYPVLHNEWLEIGNKNKIKIKHYYEDTTYDRYFHKERKNQYNILTDIFKPQLLEIPVDPLAKHLIKEVSSMCLSFGIELVCNEHSINVTYDKNNNSIICIYIPAIKHTLCVNRSIYEKYIVLKGW